MGQNQFSNHPEWSLVEDIARIVYKNDIKLLTKADIKEIEESIDDGTRLSIKNSGVGEMNIEIGIIKDSVSIGFTIIGAIISYLSWRYPLARTQADDTTNQHPNIDFKAIGQHQIKEAILELINDPNTPNIIKEELLKRGDIILSAIVAIILKLQNPRDKEDSNNK